MAYPNNKETIKKDWTNITPVKDTHPNEHNLVGGVVEALQDKVGINGDSNTDSFDYKLSTVTGSEKAASDADVTQVQTNLTDHENDTANPHSVNKTQVGLGNVTNDEQVALTGDQTVAGVKTFSSSPVVPTPTTGTQAVNKNYVDSATGSGVGFIQGVLNDVTAATDPIDFNGTPTISSSGDFTESAGVITVQREGVVVINWNANIFNSRGFDFNMILEINGIVPADFQETRMQETQGSWQFSFGGSVIYVFSASSGDTIELKTTGTLSGDTLKGTLSVTIT